MADEDTPAEDTSDDDIPGEDAAEGTPVEDAAVEDTPVEDAPVQDAAIEEAPVENAAAETGSPNDGPTSAGESRRPTARVAAVVAGAVLASAAAITGAVWAISAIVDDDDDYDDYGACCYEDYATAVAPEELRGVERDWGPRPDRDRGERAERRRDERLDRERDERFDRDRDRDRNRSKRAERDKHGPDKEREERYGGNRADGSGPDKPDAAEGCTTILSFGTGDDAVTVLVCNAPRAAWPDLDPGDEGRSFKFRKLPPDAFRFFPFSNPRGERMPFEGGEWPFGPGPMPWDRDGGPFEDGWPFWDSRPGEGGPPFDLKEFFRGERFGDGELPFDLEEFFGDGVPFDLEEFFGGERFGEGELPFDLEEFLEERLDRGDRGFRFRDDGTGDGLCFQLGEEQEACIADLDQLSDEERAQFEQMLEMLEDFGLGGFLGGLLDSLDGLELEFPESRTEPAGVMGA